MGNNVTSPMGKNVSNGRLVLDEKNIGKNVSNGRMVLDEKKNCPTLLGFLANHKYNILYLTRDSYTF